MKNKYYTPSIEEFRVGFEYEYNNTWGGFSKRIVTEENLMDKLISIGSGNDRVPFNYNWRVKYLDKKDIESLGFSYYKTHPGMEQIEFDKGEYELTYDPNFKGKQWLRINLEGEGDVTLFSGSIKNKSELKKLLKFITIK
jgi:hypothetical protein